MTVLINFSDMTNYQPLHLILNKVLTWTKHHALLPMTSFCPLTRSFQVSVFQVETSSESWPCLSVILKCMQKGKGPKKAEAQWSQKKITSKHSRANTLIYNQHRWRNVISTQLKSAKRYYLNQVLVTAEMEIYTFEMMQCSTGSRVHEISSRQDGKSN